LGPAGACEPLTLSSCQSPAGPKPVTATFASGQVSGFSGVNTYSGPYTAGQDGAFKAGPLASTMMAGGPEASQLETGYLKALESATSYYAADGKLTLFSPAGAAIVVYLPAK
jgi:heat shock protein HslJ